ncbi:MAG: hypothetical protein JNL51_12070 [Chitinophagaceae bacterium]|nr:hypothetical protein [Chitinophagaceae bacterium]
MLFSRILIRSRDLYRKIFDKRYAFYQRREQMRIDPTFRSCATIAPYE